MNYNHTQKVRVLYKTILKLHKGLPEELQILGTNYVRDEFKRHKKCDNKEAQVFVSEWTVIPTLPCLVKSLLFWYLFSEICLKLSKAVANRKDKIWRKVGGPNKSRNYWAPQR